MINRRHFLYGLAVSACAAGSAAARPADVFSHTGHAIRGIDPVAYFRKSAPVAGSDAYRLMWHKAIWRFESAANMAAFEADPRAYAPRYGGYCAMSLTTGELSESDPRAWIIYEDRLYLTRSVAARDAWLRDPAGHIALADAHWPQGCAD